MYIAIFCFIFSDYSEPRGDNGYLALKILTAHATLQETKELKRLQAVQHSTGLPSFHDHFSENSHHGRHLCFGFNVVGFSVEDLRLSLPTKTLPVYIVQKVVASVLDELTDLHQSRIVHCGPYIPHLFLQKLYQRLTQHSCYT